MRMRSAAVAVVLVVLLGGCGGDVAAGGSATTPGTGSGAHSAAAGGAGFGGGGGSAGEPSTAGGAAGSGGAPSTKVVLSVVSDGPGEVAVGEPGESCAGTCLYELEEGSIVGLTAVPDEGAAFVGWSGDCGGVEQCNVTMDGPRSVAAHFVEMAWLEVAIDGPGVGVVTSQPGGIACPGACAAPFVPGAQVELQAEAGLHSAFEGWSGDCSGDKGCVLLMDGSREVEATFKWASYGLTVKIVADPAGQVAVTSTPPGIDCGCNGSCTCSAEFPALEKVVLKADLGLSGTIFAGWKGDCAGTGECTLWMDGPKEVKAYFMACCGCAGGTACCNCVCVDFSMDPNNCGTCHLKCGVGEKCWNGACVVP
ncbi:MAG: hypothetical protein HY744_24820 [Deltaproteobacteria bacterium]|nr:hypothetical protein [Deltaproteobacteria bacterium]